MELYRYLYRLLDLETPLKARDCGKLCNGACCEESDEGEGMYLFPGEEKLFSGKESWYLIDSTDFLYGQKTAKFVMGSAGGICGLCPAGFSRWPRTGQGRDWN